MLHLFNAAQLRVPNNSKGVGLPRLPALSGSNKKPFKWYLQRQSAFPAGILTDQHLLVQASSHSVCAAFPLMWITLNCSGLYLRVTDHSG